MQTLDFVDFIGILNSEEWSLSSEAKFLFNNYKISPYRHQCSKPEYEDISEVFLVSKCIKNHCIVYDETRSQFAIAELKGSRSIDSWCLVGTLESALMELEKYNFVD